jgi:hypothetical protein
MQHTSRRYWVEKTLLAGRPDRKSGPHALGKALWSPQVSRDNRDFYRLMREVRPGDIVFHFVDDRQLLGVSRAASAADASFTGLPDTEWAGRPAYRVALEDYVPLDPPIQREEILGPEGPRADMQQILNNYRGLFFNRNFELQQGAYLTEAPTPLVEQLNRLYRERTSNDLPHLGIQSTPQSGTHEAASRAIEPLSPRAEQIKDVLDRKGQIILHGPPGTGKTFHALSAAQELISRELFHGRSWNRLEPMQQKEVSSRLTFLTFHPSYSYEDLIEGFRPVLRDGVPTFELRDGVFLESCKRAEAKPDSHHIIVVDEINRANLSSILGELITLLELDKRGTVQVELPLSSRTFTVPRNLWIIGTMNTADRSISLLDTALRRRFGFAEFTPDPALIDSRVDHLSLAALLQELNRRIRLHVARNARELQIGHAYFMESHNPIQSKSSLLRIMRDDIIPLLSEYCFDNYNALREVLGGRIIDAERQVVRAGIFENPEVLYQALLELATGDTSDSLAVETLEAFAPDDEENEGDASNGGAVN